MNLSEYLNNMDRPCQWTHKRLLEKTKLIYKRKAKVKPTYYIINGSNIVGYVFERNYTKTILMLSSNVDLSYGLKFIDSVGKPMEDIEAEEILESFLFWK